MTTIASAPLPGDLRTEREAADYLRASIFTLRNWRCKGIGPRFVKVGARMVRYPFADLRAFAAQVTKL